MFPPPCSVDAVVFDGHFGVHRQLLPGADPRRTKNFKRRPNAKKAANKAKGKKRKARTLKPDQRSATCALKCHHAALDQRTGGWQFALDPTSRRLLGALEHKENETNKTR